MVNPLVYLREVNQELRRVTWPTQQQTIKMTILVISISVLVALYITGLDFVFSEIITKVIG